MFNARLSCLLSYWYILNHTKVFLFFLFHFGISFFILSVQYYVEVAIMGSGWGQGKLCYRFFFLSDSILRLFYFYPTCLVDVTPWTRRIIRKKIAIDRRLFFSFISWVQQLFNGWGNFPRMQLKWLNSPVKVFKIRQSFLGINVSSFVIFKL